jgi:hypothetical protein
VYVCVDACFTQKRNRGMADPPKFYLGTHFIPEGLSAQMEEYVEGVRDTGPKKLHNKKPRKATVVPVPNEGDLEVPSDEDKDGYEHPSLKLSRSVLNGCEASFKAADESARRRALNSTMTRP